MYPPETPLPFSPAENGFSESFEKLSTAQLTCSEGALFQYMVMRNVQLTGFYREEVHSKGGGGEEGRQYSAANYTELFMLHTQVKKNLDIYKVIGSLML